ncbi:hypothetical protein SETIT_9G141700v2 [Setaria italica]|uniref:Uncharacterized protein n=1 Tax=Setaria italica TaxID=4555 RepID=A0A368SGE9_SETIT|nr:uncharacterized protein LOC101763498 [Setaria italica]RCV41512.1 hypothetical protein SETIT_9G141700v2 [Setaria italica]
MNMKPGAVAASRSGGGTVAFSWEQEPGVSKQSPAETKKPTAGAPRTEAVSKRTLATAKKEPAPAAVVPARPHRLRVPPPPGGPGAPAVSQPGKSGGGRRSRGGVRPRDDPFLAAYLACTDNGGGNSKGAQKLLGWAGLGLGLGLRGLGLSCKTSCGAVEECVVTLARIPELDED